MASIPPLPLSDRRPLTGVDLPRPALVGEAVRDPISTVCCETSLQRSTRGVQAILTYNARSADVRGLVLCIAMYGSGGTSDDAF
jgi:hypothetical protein